MKISLFIMLFFSTFICSAKMVFQKEVDSKRLIVLADDQGKNQIVISNPSKDTYHPEISSSGQYVAYSEGVIQPGTNTQVQIVVQDLKNSIKEVWSPIDNQYIHVEFSGNGRYLVFSGPNPKTGKQNIFIVDLIQERKKGPDSIQTLDKTVVHNYKPEYKILESRFDCYAPAVSSDGSIIIYHQTKNKNDKKAPKQLIAYDVSKDKTQELTLKDKHAMFPSMSPDDRYVAYVSKDDGQWDIYIYDLWTNTNNKVTNDPEIEFTPSFKDSSTIYFTRFTDSADQMGIDIYFISLDSFKQVAQNLPTPFLADPIASEYAPSFSNTSFLKKSSLQNFPAPERSSFGSVTHQGRVYIAGGHQGPEHTYPKESFLDILQAYDIDQKTWITLAPMNLAKHGFQMAAYQDYIYVFGGFTFSEQHSPKWKSVDTIEKYNIRTNKWETLKTKLPQPRSSNALAVVNKKVYLIGGWDSTPKFNNDKEGRFLPEIDVFNLESETVTTLSYTLPSPLRRALTAVNLNNEIYLLGGIGEGSSHFEWIDNVTAFNPITETWSEKAPLPFPTFAPGAGVLGDTIYLMGGMILKDLKSLNLNYVDDIYKYSPNLNTWSHTGIYMNENKGFPQVVPLSNYKLGILGGHTYVFTPQGIIDHPVSSFETLQDINIRDQN